MTMCNLRGVALNDTENYYLNVQLPSALQSWTVSFSSLFSC